MDRRLNDVVRMLEELKNKMPTSSHPSGKTAHTTEDAFQPVENQPGHSVKPNNTIPGCQSDSTMAAHSEFAHDFIQKTVTTDASVSHDPEMHKVFTALKDTIRSFGPSGVPTSLSYPHAVPIQRPSLRGCEMPPIEKVVELIRNPNCKLQHHFSLFETPYFRFLNLCPLRSERLELTNALTRSDQHIARTTGLFLFFPIDNLADLSLGVYFSQEYSETDFVTVNVGLHYLFQAYSSQVAESEREKCLQFANMCRDNIDTGLSNLPLYLPSTAGTVVALLCGVSVTETTRNDLLCP